MQRVTVRLQYQRSAVPRWCSTSHIPQVATPTPRTTLPLSTDDKRTSTIHDHDDWTQWKWPSNYIRRHLEQSESGLKNISISFGVWGMISRLFNVPFNTCLDWNSLRIVTGLYTGHSILNRHLLRKQPILLALWRRDGNSFPPDGTMRLLHSCTYKYLGKALLGLLRH